MPASVPVLVSAGLTAPKRLEVPEVAGAAVLVVAGWLVALVEVAVANVPAAGFAPNKLGPVAPAVDVVVDEADVVAAGFAPKRLGVPPDDVAGVAAAGFAPKRLGAELVAGGAAVDGVEAAPAGFDAAAPPNSEGDPEVAAGAAAVVDELAGVEPEPPPNNCPDEGFAPNRDGPVVAAAAGWDAPEVDVASGLFAPKRLEDEGCPPAGLLLPKRLGAGAAPESLL